MRNALFILTSLVASQLVGCTVYTSDTVIVDQPAPAPHLNLPPEIISVESGVYWDSFNRDDIWYFDAYVTDPNGPFDIIAVWADVYDDYRGGFLVDAFELYPTDDPYVWFSDWLGHTTYLDPFYTGYTVEFVVYDSWESVTIAAAVPYTYY